MKKPDKEARRAARDAIDAGEYIDPDTGEVIQVERAAPAPLAAPEDDDPEGYAAIELPGDEAFTTGMTIEADDIVRQVTVPVLKWDPGRTIVCRFDAPFARGKDLRGGRSVNGIKDPPLLALISGALPNGTAVQRMLIIGEVLRAEMEENFPDGGYVGRWFAMLKIAPNTEKEQRYATYQIIEVRDPRDKAARTALPRRTAP